MLVLQELVSCDDYWLFGNYQAYEYQLKKPGEAKLSARRQLSLAQTQISAKTQIFESSKIQFKVQSQVRLCLAVKRTYSETEAPLSVWFRRTVNRSTPFMMLALFVVLHSLALLAPLVSMNFFCGSKKAAPPPAAAAAAAPADAAPAANPEGAAPAPQEGAAPAPQEGAAPAQ
uniref:Transmembrane protein n=1 Tax=Steinernema glaseri TaxID=37863 RepID=A0A1I8ARC3_9BILA